METRQNEPITTQTEQIKLQFRNNSEQEVQYLETADDVNHKTVSIEPLESGTYRFVFEQGYGWGDSDAPVYISQEFEVAK